jgi:hypothetical protein
VIRRAAASLWQAGRVTIRVALASAAALLLLSGCLGTGADPATPEAPDAGPAVGAEPGATQRCENEEFGFGVEYPGDWHTNPGELFAACSLFDPDPLELEHEAQLAVEVAVLIRREDVRYTDMIEPDPFFEDMLSEERTTVANRNAIVAEARARATSAIPEGTVSYRYYVDLGEESIIAETYDAGDLDYEAKKRVLDEMMASLEVLEGS